MYVKRTIGAGLVLSLVASLGLVLGAPNTAHASHDGSSSSGDTQTVNCGGFFNTSINSVIQQSDLGRRLTINVKGHCVENVVIDRDHVTLQPAGSGGSIEAADDTKDTILITGRHVTVQDFDGSSISGGNIGIAVNHGGAASILNNHITGANVGVALGSASAAMLDGNHIENSSVFGVVVVGGSNARFVGNQITYNDGIAILVARSGSVNLAGGNTVSNNGGAGIFAGLVASINISGANTFADNGGSGIFCDGHANLRITPNDLSLLVFGGNGSGPILLVNGCSTNVP